MSEYGEGRRGLEGSQTEDDYRATYVEQNEGFSKRRGDEKWSLGTQGCVYWSSLHLDKDEGLRRSQLLFFPY